MTNKNLADNLTVLIPGYNEAESIADTIKSVQNQTTPPKEIIFIDDGSTDNSGDIARALGVTVLRSEQNIGTKAGAQNFALKQTKTEFIMAIDGDTTLAKNAIELLMPSLEDKSVAAVCGAVIPRHKKTLWERGRYIEYLFAFAFYKQIQNYYGKPLISSGCFSAYRAEYLKAEGGWSTRTMAEDMDLTWSFYQKGYKVKFVPEAVCYPIEPNNFEFMRKQLKRWSHGFVQNVVLHFRGVSKFNYLRSIIAVGVWDSVIASVSYLIIIPILAIYFANPWFLLIYIIDLPAVLVPVILYSYQRKETMMALASIPSFLVLRFVNCFFVLEAFFTELVLKKRLTTYEKGH